MLDVKQKEKEATDLIVLPPSREYDAQLLHKYYKYSLTEILNKNLTLVAEYFNIAQVRFTLDDEICPTAMLATTATKREIWFNINFLLDEVKVGHELNPEDYIGSRGKNYKNIYQGIDILVMKRFAFLISHELMHSLLGHSKDFYTAKMKNGLLRNVAIDIYINQLLYNLGFDVTLTEDFLNRDGKSPEAYNVGKWASPLYTPTNSQEEAFKSKLNKLDLTAYDIYKYLLKDNPNLKDESLQELMEKLLGNHSDKQNSGGNNGQQNKSKKSKGDGESASSDKDDEGDDKSNNPSDKDGDSDSKNKEKDLEQMGGLIRELNKTLGSSKFGSMFEDSILVEPKQDPILLKALKASEVLKSLKGQIKLDMQSYKFGEKRYSSPRIDPKCLTRAELAGILVKDIIPPFFRKTKGSLKTKAVIYLDVSGSIYYLVPHLYSLLVYASEIFEMDIFLFSTTLDPIKLDELKSGNVKSTGGTDFNVWVEHLRENKYPVALIISDGYDSINAENTAWLKQEKPVLNWIIVESGRLEQEIRDVSNKVWELDIKKK